MYTLSLFIEKAIKIHNNKYNYDLVDYKNTTTKIDIICLEHGVFNQSPHHHLEGQGCPLCAWANNKPPIKLKNPVRNKEKAIAVHGDTYDYFKTDFNLVKNKVIIICKIHGEFLQTLEKHLMGRGCPDCGGSKKKTLDQFMEEAKSVHGELYDYSSSNYTNFEEKLIIICKKHGEFYQTPHNHIIGKQGCPRCVHRISKVETEWLDYLELPNDKNHRNVFIKLSNRNIKADGYDPKTNTIYEFYGDYYHGNPRFYLSAGINPHTKCTFGELYQRTLEREKSIIDSGYKLVAIWEYEWNAIKGKI